MTTKKLMAAAAAAALLAALAPQGASALQRSGDDTLRRVDPIPTSVDRETWRAALEATDLVEREQRYAALMEAARSDPAAADELRAWIDAETDPELEWTLRLALRELEREARGGFGGRMPGWFQRDGFGFPRFDGAPFDGFGWQRGRSPFFGGPWGQGDPFQDLEEELRELFGGGWGSFPGQSPGQTPGTPLEEHRSESFQLESGPDGVRVEVREREGSDEHVKTYEAPSLEELFEQHPELRERIDVAPTPPGTADGRIDELLDRMRRRFGGPGLRADVPTDRLGILVRPSDQWSASVEGLEPGVGLVVDRVFPATLADALGIQAGDILVSLNGTTLRGAADVASVLAERKPDEPVTVERIGADGQRRTLRWEPEARG